LYYYQKCGVCNNQDQNSLWAQFAHAQIIRAEMLAKEKPTRIGVDFLLRLPHKCRPTWCPTQRQSAVENAAFLNVKCTKMRCRRAARKPTPWTVRGFVLGLFSRFACADNDQAMLDYRVQYWLPVDQQYIGGGIEPRPLFTAVCALLTLV